ncbi:MAG: PAS domain-containing protein [Hyphomicrobiaceae bacterium]
MKLGKLFASSTQEPAVKFSEMEDRSAIDEQRGIVEALMRSEAFIAFKPDGTILTANDNFLSAMGYQPDEVFGKHHSIFCERGYAQSSDYRRFWEQLARGEFQSGEFKRIGKNGKEVHIQATYNPITDASGQVIKVVKFATDISERVANVEELARALQRLSKADLMVRIDKPFGTDLERLRTDFNSAVMAVEQAVSIAKSGADAISRGTAEISQAAGDLANRTEDQAARLSQTSHAFGEISEAVKQTASGAATARRIVDVAHADAEQSGVIVNQAVEAMRSIETSSNEIAHIIGVIDEIAFQTNLLALNAGVEAARAGEAGRGFAVVASEVRALAQRAADAAKQIKELITISSERVVQGVGRVEETSVALQKINDGVTEVAEQMAEIVQAAESQADGLQRVGELVSQLDTITQQNVAMVEETTAASRTLADESSELARNVNQFETAGSTQRHGVSRGYGRMNAVA